MNAFLNVLKYGLVVVLVILAVFIIACGCLVLFPSVNLFGLSYVTYDSKPVLKQFNIVEEPYTTSDTIRVDAGVFDVKIEIVNTESITNGATHLNVIMERHLNGFAIGDTSDKIVRLKEEQVQEGGKSILDLTITQPKKALLFNTNSFIKLLINKDLLKEKDLIIKTTTGGIEVAGKPVYDESNNNTTTFMEFKSLAVETDKGAITLGCATYNSPINIVQNSGNIKALVDLNVSATISQKTGFGNITLQNVGAAGNPQNLVVDNIYNSTVKVNTVYGDFLGKDVQGGNFKIDTIKKDAVVNNDYADFQINNISGDLVYNAKEGALSIVKATAKANINHKDGIITIGQLGDNTKDITHSINTEKASVKINKLYNSIAVSTTKGAVDITGEPFDENDPEDPEDDIRPVTINVVSQDGEIKLKEVFGNVIYKCESGSSSIAIEYDDMVDGSTLLNQSGAINVLMPYNKIIPMWLRWETNKSAKINLISYESTYKTSVADTAHVVMDGTTEKGISINGATNSTAQFLQIATRMGAISVNRKSAAS